ncbi:MAG: methyltransferase domain-containing protein [Adhaeribacter sp.]
MFKHRATQTELMDDLHLSGEALARNLAELEIINAWLGGFQTVTGALARLPATAPLHLADLGCGGGDTLRAIARWARKKQVPVQLMGFDANAFMVAYARRKCRSYPNIEVRRQDVFSPAFQSQQFDVITCSLFCHHFSDQQLVALLRQLRSQARVALIINDLHRHPLAYYFIKWVTRLLPCSHLVRHDAPLSVLRAFTRPELKRLLQQAGLQRYSLRWSWAFRWQIIIPADSDDLFKIQ